MNCHLSTIKYHSSLVSTSSINSVGILVLDSRASRVIRNGKVFNPSDSIDHIDQLVLEFHECLFAIIFLELCIQLTKSHVMPFLFFFWELCILLAIACCFYLILASIHHSASFVLTNKPGEGKHFIRRLVKVVLKIITHYMIAQKRRK